MVIKATIYGTRKNPYILTKESSKKYTVSKFKGSKPSSKSFNTKTKATDYLKNEKVAIFNK